ncbi:MAG: PQQ-dependent sugar dehydrogenase, partial [Planctomycetota bacterium]
AIEPGDADYGNLYVAIGDGGSGNDPWEIAEDPSQPYGKILRIDPIAPNGASAYGIVQENVFASDGNASTLAEVYAYGLRNPQRFGWDDSTGDLYAADIGQGAWEEINLITNGGHFGWNDEEGDSNPANVALEDPIANYNHSGDLPLPDDPRVTGGLAITTGEVVRGANIPGLEGALLVGDFPTGVPLYIDVTAGPPQQRSGVDPFAELILVDVEGDGLPVDLLDVVNDARNTNRLRSTDRVDLRWSLGIDGRVFLTNKKDGVIRELVHLVLGDFDLDFDVDGSDFLEWQKGESSNPLSEQALTDWAANFGATSAPEAVGVVPEPPSILLAVIGLAFVLANAIRLLLRPSLST